MEELDAYLASKKIDAKNFAQGDPDRYQAFARVFGQVSPESFTQQKLFLINGLRRRFPLPQEVESTEPTLASKSAKPVVRKPQPKFKKT